MATSKETIECNKQFYQTLNSKKRIIVHQGGSRSGKTYAICQYIIYLLTTRKDPLVVTIARKTLPALKGSIYRDFMEIAEKTGILYFAHINKAELTRLTNISSIVDGVKKILKINKKIKIIATNSKNNAIYGDNKSIIKIKPPKIKVQNENGAGDALAGMMLYLLSKGYNKEEILKYSVACGSYYANGNRLSSKKDLLKIKNISRRVKLKQNE